MATSLSYQQKKKWGRRVLLGDNFDRKVQLYLNKVRKGGLYQHELAMAAARGIVLTSDRSMLEFGGYVDLNRHWAYLLRRMNFVPRKVTTARASTPLQTSIG